MRAEELLPGLIQAAGESPSAVLDALAGPLTRSGFRRSATREGPEAVLWTRGSPRLLLSGHVDVVPVGEGWTRDAHGGEHADGRIWGRGACDMLGAIAAFVAAAHREPHAPCAILLTTDEEIGMRAAEGALRDGLLDGIEACVLGEPTDFAIGRAEKGVLWLRAPTRGRNAHGSMPELGDNAAERMVRALHAMEQVRAPGEHPLLGKPTRNLGRLAAGEAVNQVPASAIAELDVRYLPGARPEDVIEQLRAAAKAAGEDVSFEVLSDHAPFETPASAPLVRAAQDALVAARRTASPVLGLPYGTEASKFAPRGIECVILGPGEPALAHTNRESVRVDALREAEQVYAHMMASYARRGA